MKNLTKYALAAALVIPAVFTTTNKEVKADRLTINKKVADAVNVRESASETNNIIGLIKDENKSYEILDKANGWFKIDFDGKEAYVGTPWFNVTKETEVVSPANFRAEDNLNSEIYEVLDGGVKVEVVEVANNGFVKVKVKGKEGFIYNNLLKSFKEKKEQANNQAAKEVVYYNTDSQDETYEAPAEEYYEEQTYEAPAEEYYYEEEETYQGDSNWAKEWIAQRESGGSYTAYNPAGGYYGRYQLNPSLVSYGASPAEQEAAADNYVYQRYGSWEAAQNFWANNGWY